MYFKMKKILLAALFVFASCSKEKAEEMLPKVGTVTESVYASGVIKAENQYTVFSNANGFLQKINVSVGQEISKGQSLFQIESEKAQLNTDNARIAYELSKNNNQLIRDRIAEMEFKVQAAKDKLTLDESIYKRSKNVKEYNAISEVDFEKVELAYKNSKSNYASALNQLSQLKIQLQSEQSRNSNNLKISQKSQSDFTVKSAFSGELFDVLVKEGTLISTQTPLAIIGIF